MLENILDMVKNYAQGAVATQAGIPEEKKQETVEATTEAVTDGLKQHFNLSNLSNLAGLFSGGKNVPANSGNPIMSSIQTTLVNTLVQRVGLSQGIASSLASNVVPALMNAFTQKLNDPGEKGFSLDSLVGAFSENDSKEHADSGVLGTLGKLFS